jgi:hypothetical protein
MEIVMSTTTLNAIRELEQVRGMLMFAFELGDILKMALIGTVVAGVVGCILLKIFWK